MFLKRQIALAAVTTAALAVTAPMGLAQGTVVVRKDTVVTVRQDTVVNVHADTAVVTTTVSRPGTSAPPGQPMSIAATLVQLPSYKTFVSLLEEAHLMPTLRGAAKMTVFAPTDDAFAAIPQAQLDSLRANPTALRKMLLNHVVTGAIDTREVLKLKNARTLEGSLVRFGYENGKPEINDQPIIQPAILATNGFIYGVTGVIGMSGTR
jgi:uncharacterized surface protein with fasciclin (FAS1) repeats